LLLPYTLRKVRVSSLAFCLFPIDLKVLGYIFHAGSGSTTIRAMSEQRQQTGLQKEGLLVLNILLSTLQHAN
jgi:hypothetical protein